ncbi:MAG: HAMP domain-containing sensor histidine kinase [Negativicutes bacterium]|nr:HAMP domain-containing sensor histidine kinase [Negativicutes bacterium]
MIRSIFGRLLLSHIVVILLTTITFGVLMSYLIREHVVENKRRELLAKGNVVVAIISPTVASGQNPTRLELIGELVGVNSWLATQEGKILIGNPPPRWVRIFSERSEQFDGVFAGNSQSWVRNSRNQPDPSITVAIPIPAAKVPTALFLYTPITGINQTIQALDRLLIIALLLGMLAATALGFFIARSLTRPIANISRAAARFAGGDYDSRVTTAGTDEIGRLGKVFNSMAESLAHTEQNRREFLANVSHELKTPVASIQALAEALHDGVVDGAEKRQRYLTTIVEESQHIDRLIRDLLDLAQLEAGELLITPEKLDLSAYLPAELAKYHHLLDNKNLDLQLDIPAGTPPVLADAWRLSQIIANLLGNAVRYSPDGSAIEIAVTAVSSHIAIAITDHGPGIPAADQPFLWERFYRVDKSRSRSGGGTGLGLAITKRLVTAMQGEIAVHSVPGEGATFTVTLPLAK